MRTLTAEQLDQLIVDAMAADDWASVADLEPRLDAATRPRTMPPIVNSALYYASIGLRVFPLQPGGRHLPLSPGEQDPSKIPHTWDDECVPQHRGTRGVLEAASDSERIVAWWRRWPDSNVAIATGHLVDVIDVDGPAGVHSWAHVDNLPPVLGVVSTPRPGGTHLYVAASGNGNGAGILPGVDYRGRGGYVCAPPSVSNDGVAYRWRRPLRLPAAEVAA
jgi:hypothetical protein